MGFDLVDVTGPITDPDGAPANGSIDFTLSFEMRSPDGVDYPVRDITARVIDGAMLQPLVATDVAKQAYWVRPRLGQRPGVPYSVIIPSGVGSISLGSIPPASVIPPIFYTGSYDVDFEENVRANSPDQLEPMGADLTFNGFRGIDLANGVHAQDIAVLGQTNAWVNDSNNWTRTGNQTFTIPTDSIFLYTKGTKIKWTESGGTVQKYGVVVSSSWNGTVTTVNIMATADFVLSTAGVDAGSGSYSFGNPPFFPSTFTWAPAFTGFASAPTIIDSWWSVDDNKCTVSYVGTPAVSNATTLTAVAPIPASRSLFLPCFGTNNGANSLAPINTSASVATTASTTTLTFAVQPGTAAWTSGAGAYKSVAFEISFPI